MNERIYRDDCSLLKARLRRKEEKPEIFGAVS